MKKQYHSLFLVVIVALIITLMAMSVYADILNPGFESGVLSPWYKGGGTGPESPNVTTAESHTGIYSATWVGNQELRQDFAPIDTDMITEISFWSYQPELDFVALQTSLFYSDSTLDQFVFQVTGTGWLKSDVTSRLTSNKELVGFSVWGYSGAGLAEDRTYLDDVTIASGGAEVPEPTTMLLLGSGLIGLVGYGRKKFFKK